MKKVKTEKVALWQRVAPRIIQTIVWYPIYFFVLKLFLRLHVEGKENVVEAAHVAQKNKRGILFVSNHISEFDPMASLVASPPYSWQFPMFWVAKEGKRYDNPKFSWKRIIYSNLFLRPCGAQALINGVKNYEESLKRHSWLLKRGYSVCIYPEGSMIDDKKKIGGGAGFLMESLNPVVIPITVSGVKGISVKEFLNRERTLRVKFGKMLEPEELLDPELPVPERYKLAVRRVLDVS